MVSVKQVKPLLKLLGLAGVVVTLIACSEEPSPWTKSSSPWDQEAKSDIEAPAADSYKADLEMAQEPATTSEVELSYQAEPVESFTPEVVAEVESEVEPEDVAVEEEPVSGGRSSILDQPANFYTVQLMASVDIDRVYRFAEQNQISTEFIVPTQRDGVTWHVLLLGIYENYSAASAGKDEVAPLLKTQPWIRSVGSVQKLMQQ